MQEPTKEFEGKYLKEIKQRAAEERYRMFAHHYVHNGLNAAEAARKTGYGDGEAGRQKGHDLLTIEYVNLWITKLQEEKKFAAVITYEYNVKKLEEARMMAELGKTNEKGLYDAKAVVLCTQALNQMHGYNAPEKHLVMPVQDQDAERTANYIKQFLKDE